MVWWKWLIGVFLLLAILIGWRIFRTGGAMLSVQEIEKSAVALMAKGKHADAERLLRKALREAESNMSDANVAPVMINLAVAIGGQQRPEEAEIYAKRGLEILRATHGPTNTLVAYSLKVLSELSSMKDDHTMAESYQQEVVIILNQEETHPELSNPEMREELKRSVEHLVQKNVEKYEPNTNETPDSMPQESNPCSDDIEEQRSLAEQGVPEAQTMVGWCYLMGENLEQDDSLAFKWFEQAALQDFAGAQYNLGYMYYNGRGVSKDLTTALLWFRRAADQGFIDAQLAIGEMLIGIEGVTKNYKEAFHWFELAANNGSPEAQVNLSKMYLHGLWVEKDQKQTFYWVLKAAEQGVAEVYTQVAVMYHEGRGVKQNPDEALKWYQKAADLGVAQAQYNLGTYYIEGKYLPQDDEKAVYWFKQAAYQGDILAQYNLGLMHIYGRGTHQDMSEGYAWWAISAEGGNNIAINNLLELKSELSRADIKKGNQRLDDLKQDFQYR